MVVLAINVRSGGSPAGAERLVERCATHHPDVIVLAEYRDTAPGERLRDAARRAGFQHQAVTPHRGNGVAIAAREAFESVLNPFGLGDDEYPNAIVLARFAALDIFGLYLPGQDRKRPHLRFLTAAAERYNERGRPAMAIGDFNSGRNESDIEINVRSGRLADEFSTADLYAELERYWTEAWLYEHPDAHEY
ncbi:MAG: endonuclease/exonuclease/phosphatase family protein, partial [Candidatus Dormibacteraeota bacterium]|nr:endonuclease/exonuclease/phosphatase family protein [Candidatus Dormibacteraeota bacterium]